MPCPMLAPLSAEIAWTELVSSSSLPCSLPTDAMPGGVLSSSGSLGPRFPAFLGTTTPLRLPTYRLGSLRFSLAPRYSGPTLSSLSTVAVSFGWSSRGLLYPGPPCPSLRESRLDLPSSLASLVDACPALRPRWGSPAHRRSRRGMLPSEPAMPSARTQDLLPACRAGFGRVGLPGGPLPGHPLGGLDGFHRTRVPFPPSRVLLGTTPDESGFTASRR